MVDSVFWAANAGSRISGNRDSVGCYPGNFDRLLAVKLDSWLFAAAISSLGDFRGRTKLRNMANEHRRDWVKAAPETSSLDLCAFNGTRLE